MFKFPTYQTADFSLQITPRPFLGRGAGTQPLPNHGHVVVPYSTQSVNPDCREASPRNLREGTRRNREQVEPVPHPRPERRKPGSRQPTLRHRRPSSCRVHHVTRRHPTRSRLSEVGESRVMLRHQKMTTRHWQKPKLKKPVCMFIA